MFELAKKYLYTGIGLAVKTRDEVREMTNDIIRQSEMSEQEGRKFMDEMMSRYDNSRKNMEDKINDQVEKVFKKTNVATKDEVENLRNEVEALKMEIRDLKMSLEKLKSQPE